jgi:cell division protein FtsQ
MWHKPQLMTAVSDLLLVAAAAALLVAAVVWSTRLPLFPLREVAVTHELQEVRRSEVERSLSGLLRGNFFSINLEALRQSLEKLPWVRHADVRRRWPARVEISIEEHQPAARWGEGTAQLVNTHGEVFVAPLSREMHLPLLTGPDGTSAELLSRYSDFAQMLKPTGRWPAQVVLSPRLAWLLKLEDGMQVELGREQAKAPISARLQRFVEHYATVSDTRRPRPVAVDMRYPNGFALRFTPAGASRDAPGTSHEIRGKK